MMDFYEKFKKYTPTDDDRRILDRVVDFKVRVDVDKRVIHADVTFDGYVPYAPLERIEEHIREAYELNYMAIHPSFRGVSFDLSYMEHVFYELAKLTAEGKGFFAGAESALEDADVTGSAARLAISLKYGGKTMLCASGCDTLIADTVYKMFGVRPEVEFVGRTSVPFDERIFDVPAFDYSALDVPDDEEGEAAAPAAPSSLARGETAFSVDTDAEKVVSGGMTFDISSITDVYNHIKSLAIVPMRAVDTEEGDFTVCGEVFSYQAKTTKKGDKNIVTFYLTDGDASVVVKWIYDVEKEEEYSKVKDGAAIMLKGFLQMDKFDNEPVVKPKAIALIKRVKRTDDAPEKRVELHLHTTLSAKDATFSPKAVIETAARFGHKAIAVTDHGNLQAFPEIMTELQEAVEKSKILGSAEDLKILYGVEAYFVDDTATAVFGQADARFAEDEFCVFDIETTGLSVKDCAITEIGAVRYKNGKILDTFETFVNPKRHIGAEITDLTGITDEMVADAPGIEEVLPRFLDYVGDRVLVAHNASFDIGFIRAAAEAAGLAFEPTFVDTVALSRYCNTDLKRHKLDILAEYFGLGDFNHHRAFEDAHMLALIYEKLIEKLTYEGVGTLAELSAAMSERSDPKKLRSYHQIILVKNLTGLKNLYKLVSFSYLNYFYRHPRIPKTVLERYRDGLIIGSACEAGELYQAVLAGRPHAELVEIASFYDYLEVQPLGNNRFMLDKGLVADENALIDINKKIIALGEELGKPVVATGDVHFCEPNDEIFRQILLDGAKFEDADRHVPLYMRTTKEMLDEFSYLPPEKAYEIVVTNTNKVADMIEVIRPIPEGNYPPHMDGAEEELKNGCFTNAKRLYGDPLPPLIEKRLERELKPIIDNGFAVLYVIARRLIKYSEDNGYLVGSRGSVGSSFVATMDGISEVNPLEPHYRCPKCTYTQFFTDGSVGSGFDIPTIPCPVCGTDMISDGHDIPFETFLGFKGDKSPDIDLNFSGDVQGKVHKYTEVLFGAENVFRAGTLGTIAEKNAYGYVKKYLEKRGLALNRAETERLTLGCTGVKSTSGQHPGGIIVVPKEYEVYDFTPVQHPADDPKSDIVTTHFPFKFLHDTILKLDLLGHDVPTKYKMMEKFSGKNVLDLPMNDPDVMELFISTKSIGVEPEDIGSAVATFGLPEFGTKFVREMIVESKPKNFSDLLIISGLSHGTDVWLGNAQELIHNGTCTISEVIGTRDSIMTYLIQKGLDPSLAFKIMEITRKGKAKKQLTPDMVAEMKAHDVPDWYIDSCFKIKYMFPKAHAAAYDMSALRLGWFKVHMPQVFYAGFLSAAPGGFDASIVTKGKANIVRTIREIDEKGKDASATEKEMYATLQLCNEAYARGYDFLRPDLKKSHATYFLPEGEHSIRCPFSSLPGLGDAAAQSIYETCEASEVLSVEDLRQRGQISKSVIEILRANGVFDDVGETNQLTMFGDYRGASEEEKPKPKADKPKEEAAGAESAPNDEQMTLF